jgi:hypothetical protein
MIHGMRDRPRTYTTDSIGCVFVWALVLAIALLAKGEVAKDPPCVRRLVDGLDLGDHRSVYVSCAEVSTAVGARSTGPDSSSPTLGAAATLTSAMATARTSPTSRPWQAEQPPAVAEVAPGWTEAPATFLLINEASMNT